MKIACDHGGYELARRLTQYFNLDYLGPNTLDNGDDYPLYAQKLCESLEKDELGILICRSGQGMVIAANRYKHVRAVLVRTKSDAITTRKHNHANIICLAADSTSFENVVELIETFKKTRPDNSERHCRRVNQL